MATKAEPKGKTIAKEVKVTKADLKKYEASETDKKADRKGAIEMKKKAETKKKAKK